MAHELALPILRQIRQAGYLTRAELAKNLAISLSLVSKISAGLLGLHLIEERSTADSSSGRPADRLHIRANTAYAIGLDVGSGRQIAVICDLAGNILTSLNEPSPDQDFSYPCLEDLIRRVVEKSGLDNAQILGLGIGISNIVDGVSGTAYLLSDPRRPELGSMLTNIPVRDELAARMPYAHILVDDIVRTLGIAEVHYGQATQESNFIYLLIDTGIGMAIMLNGMPFVGASHIAGEIAHIPVGGHTVLCNCGNTGCLNMVAGINPVLRKVQQRLVESTIWSSLRTFKEMSIADVLEAGERGDKIAVQALNEAGEAMGSALAVILNLFGPSLVIAGGIMAHSTVYLESAGRVMRMRALEMATRGVALKLSKMDELGGARGAATMAINALFNPGEKDLLHLVESRVVSR